SMEKICMASSQETWMRQRSGETSAWKKPTINGGEFRIQKPPLLIWLNIAAWSDIDPETAQVDELAFRARLVTILLVLIGVASVGWVGWMFAGARGGLLSALVAGSMFLVIKYGHYSTYDPHIMGWTALCVACGVWAMQPLNTDRWRRHHLWGWI